MPLAKRALRAACALTALSLLGARGPDAPPTGDPAAGAAVAQTCAACHGADGSSNGPTWPVLAGLRATYIEKQLRDFQAGLRAEPSMTPMANTLGPQQIADVAAHYASQPRPAVRKPSGPADPGAALYLRGRPADGLPPCVGCHGSRGQGVDGVFAGGVPRIGGQHATYVSKQLTDFRSGGRTNDDKGVMAAVSRRLGDDEIAALAAYVEGLR